MRAVIVLLALCFTTLISNAEVDYIWVEGKINYQPVHFVFDTCATEVMITDQTASKLNLKIVKNASGPDPGFGRIPRLLTEKARVELFDGVFESGLMVVNVASYSHPDYDGFIGWSLIGKSIFKIDAVWERVSFPDEIPEFAKQWSQYSIDTNEDVLCLTIPDEKGGRMTVLVDTGSPGGIALSPEKWNQWKAECTNAPVTLNASYFPGKGGINVSEERWANEYSFGSLKFTGVPITRANPNVVMAGKKPYAGFIGLAALKQLDIIVDGQNARVYLHPTKERPHHYDYNRIGAVFVPDNDQSDDLKAVVISGSPAFEAGIRKDDVLLSVDGDDVTKWRTSPRHSPTAKFRESPAGTEVQLTLRRGTNVFKTTVTLKDIFPAYRK